MKKPKAITEKSKTQNPRRDNFNNTYDCPCMVSLHHKLSGYNAYCSYACIHFYSSVNKIGDKIVYFGTVETQKDLNTQGVCPTATICTSSLDFRNCSISFKLITERCGSQLQNSCKLVVQRHSSDLQSILEYDDRE